MCSDRRWSFDGVTACQGCVSANLCPRCAALVQPSAKIQLLDLRADRLAPKADTLERRFPVCWVQPRRFLRVEHGPLQACRRLTGGTRQTSLETGLSDSSPHEAVSSSPRPPHKTKARRALHRMALAGTVPLLARIPSPVTEPRTGSNVPADTGAARQVPRSLSSGAHTPDPLANDVGWVKERKRRARHLSPAAARWWARCRSAHPADRKLICLARKRNFMQWPATNWHDGQITKNLSSPLCKNIPLNVSGKSVP